MKDLLQKNLLNSLTFGIIMTAVGFFTGGATLTFPPIWPELGRLFLIYTLVHLAVSLLFDWVRSKKKAD